MATVQVIEEGFRNYIIKVDGTGVETNTLIVDVSTLNPPCTRVRLKRITYNLESAQKMQLLWDATSPTILVALNGSNDADMCFEPTAGIPNNAGAGVTGDVLLNGGTASTDYSLYIEFIKSDPVTTL
jgi:hypothetical protein